MDEYDQLEAGMDEMYEAYVEKVRNLDYLEWQLRGMSADEDAARRRGTRAARHAAACGNEEMKILRGEGNVGGDDEDFDVDEPARARAGCGGAEGGPRRRVPSRRGSASTEGPARVRVRVRQGPGWADDGSRR